ncbi:MAG: hypothetical protein AAB442_01570 [Patescibacteria group bacterium]
MLLLIFVVCLLVCGGAGYLLRQVFRLPPEHPFGLPGLALCLAAPTAALFLFRYLLNDPSNVYALAWLVAAVLPFWLGYHFGCWQLKGEPK